MSFRKSLILDSPLVLEDFRVVIADIDFSIRVDAVAPIINGHRTRLDYWGNVCALLKWTIFGSKAASRGSFLLKEKHICVRRGVTSVAYPTDTTLDIIVKYDYFSDLEGGVASNNIKERIRRIPRSTLHDIFETAFVYAWAMYASKAIDFLKKIKFAQNAKNKKKRKRR